MKNLSIKGKLYFLILFIFSAMTMHQVYEKMNFMEKSVEFELKSNQDFAEVLSVSFTNYLEKIWDTELSMGLAISVTKESSEEIGQFMKTVMENQPTIREYGWVDVSTLQMTISSNPEAIGVSLAGREYINKILNGDDKIVSNMVNSRIDNKPSFVVARGIKKDNVLKGIVIATINVEELKKDLPSSRASDSSFFGLLDNQGVFVFCNEAPDVAEKMISIKENPNIASALKGETVKSKEYLSPVTGKTMSGVSLPIQEIGWIAFANTSYEEVLMRAFMNIRDSLIILALIITACLFVSIKISRQILGPINILHSSVLKVSDGDLNARTNIDGTDELASAAKAFDQMAASIEKFDVLKTQFFSNISHELKTPLNIILASIQTIESMRASKASCHNYINLSKYIPTMKQNCFRLLRLINNLIDITRIDSGFLKFNFTNNNIVSVVEDITLSVVSYSEYKGINIIFDTEVEEKIIRCDPDKIERIVLNLLSNSIKFTPSGGNIYVNIFEECDKVVIAVKDTGIGIPQDKIPVIFERFRQVDSSLHREYEGSGIGLSLVKALVRAHRGDIHVQSQYGEGTEVTIELPDIQITEENSLTKNTFYSHNMDKVQRLNIEFSDIYN